MVSYLQPYSELSKTDVLASTGWRSTFKQRQLHGAVFQKAAMPELFVSAAQLAKIPELPVVLRQHCLAEATRPSQPVGAFLSGLVEEDLDELLAYGKQAQRGGAPLLNLGLFCVLLANAEGLPVRAEDNLSELVRRLLLMLQAQMLCLQGLVELSHSTLSLEAFDPTALKLTSAGQERFKGVSSREVPLPPQAPRPPLP